MTNEVKNDVTEDEVKSFEEAEEAGEVKTGEERELKTEDLDEEETKEDESEDESTEEETKEESDDNEVVESSTTIKEVTGETPRERALRLEVTRLRQKNRTKDQENLLKPKESKEDYEAELKELGYGDDEIKALDKAFDVIGRKKGFVRKDQSYATMANDTLSEFVEEHPEYSAENDKDDIYWGMFNSILKSDYKLTDKTPKQLKSIFNRVDKEIKEELGEKVDNGNIEAKKQKIKSASAGASASTKSKEEKVVVKTNTVSSGHPTLNFKGFDDDEVKEFTN